MRAIYPSSVNDVLCLFEVLVPGIDIIQKLNTLVRESLNPKTQALAQISFQSGRFSNVYLKSRGSVLQ